MPFCISALNRNMQYKTRRRRIDKIISSEDTKRSVIHRIEQKAYHSQAAGDIKHVRQQFRRIAGQCFAKRLAVFAELCYFAAALAERQKQAQSEGANNQPGRDKYPYHYSPGNGPQAKADGYYHTIENHHFLKHKRIKNHQQDIREDNKDKIVGKNEYCRRWPPLRI